MSNLIKKYIPCPGYQSCVKGDLGVSWRSFSKTQAHPFCSSSIINALAAILGTSERNKKLYLSIIAGTFNYKMLSVFMLGNVQHIDKLLFSLKLSAINVILHCVMAALYLLI